MTRLTHTMNAIGLLVLLGCSADQDAPDTADSGAEVTDATRDASGEEDAGGTQDSGEADAPDAEEDCREQHFDPIMLEDPVSFPRIPEIRPAAGLDYWAVLRDDDLVASGGDRCPASLSDEECAAAHEDAERRAARFGRCLPVDDFARVEQYALVVREGDTITGLTTPDELVDAMLPIDMPWEVFLLLHTQCTNSVGQMAQPTRASALSRASTDLSATPFLSTRSSCWCAPTGAQRRLRAPRFGSARVTAASEAKSLRVVSADGVVTSAAGCRVGDRRT